MINPFDIRLGNYIKRKGDKHNKHLRIVGIGLKFFIVEDNCDVILDLDEVEYIEAKEGDFDFFNTQIRNHKHPFIHKCKYLHELQNACYFLTGKEMYS